MAVNPSLYFQTSSAFIQISKAAKREEKLMQELESVRAQMSDFQVIFNTILIDVNKLVRFTLKTYSSRTNLVKILHLDLFKWRGVRRLTIKDRETIIKEIASFED